MVSPGRQVAEYLERFRTFHRALIHEDELSEDMIAALMALLTTPLSLVEIALHSRRGSSLTEDPSSRVCIPRCLSSSSRRASLRGPMDQ